MVDVHARHKRGQEGEELAVAFLKRKGLRIVARNWRKGSLELDIVAEKGDTLIFVEVRTRQADALVSAAESFSAAKARAFFKAVRAYLMMNDAWHKSCRCDLVCVTMIDGQPPQTEHYEHVLEFTPTMDRGHTSWQPW